MNPVLILYATRHGQARRIAWHLSGELLKHGLGTTVLDARVRPAKASVDGYSAAILVASVRYGKHEREMVCFVREHRKALDEIPTAFLSVSGTEATAEDVTAPAGTRSQAVHRVNATLERLEQETGFHPGSIIPVAGAMEYTKYNLVVRALIRLMARRSGTAIDTTRDREYTDWAAIDRFATDFATAIKVAEVNGHGAPASTIRSRASTTEISRS